MKTVSKYLVIMGIVFAAIWLASPNDAAVSGAVGKVVPKATYQPQVSAVPKKNSGSSTTVKAVPYVGQRVSPVPSAWKWRGTDNLTVKDKNGNKIRTTTYHYDDPPKSYDIWVDQNDRVVKVSITDPTAKSDSKKSKAKNTKPSLDTSDFVHPEDFYEWYKDDFCDYEEAEDYYYSHGGK